MNAEPSPPAEPLLLTPGARVLAIESSGRTGGVAALAVGEQGAAELLLNIDLPANPRTAATMAPAVQQVLHELDWEIESVAMVAATRGPGSFTGLRIGVTTAKMLAYLAGCPVVGVDTLDVIAAGTPLSSKAEPPDGVTLHCCLDAGRGELFAAAYRCSGEVRDRLPGELLIAVEDWLAALSPGESAVAAQVSGPALVKLADRLPPGVVVAPPATWLPQAAVVGRLAIQLAAEGKAESPFSLVPIYGRPSAAEEKRGGN